MSVLYLDAAAVSGLSIDRGLARRAVIESFAAYHRGEAKSRPKSSIEVAPGHLFQTMIASSGAQGLVATKWLGMAPASGSGGANIDAMIALNDHDSGRLLAIMDGSVITGIRTAAMSAAAAEFLARQDSRTIGFVGSGLQAREHLLAMTALLPGLQRAWILRSESASSRSLADLVRGEGLAAELTDDPESLVAGSDVIVTSVPARPGFSPFLDPGWIAPGAFVSAVDIGRSWLLGGLRGLDLVATDDHDQQAAQAPLAGNLGPRGTFDADLAELSAGAKSGRSDPRQRAMFLFRGFALGDLALAAEIYRLAQSTGRGLPLPR